MVIIDVLEKSSRNENIIVDILHLKELPTAVEQRYSVACAKDAVRGRCLYCSAVAAGSPKKCGGHRKVQPTFALPLSENQRKIGCTTLAMILQTVM